MNWYSYANPGLARWNSGRSWTCGRSPKFWYLQLYNFAMLARARPCSRNHQQGCQALQPTCDILLPCCACQAAGYIKKACWAGWHDTARKVAALGLPGAAL